MTKLIEHIAIKVVAIKNCEKTGNTDWFEIHKEKLEELIENYLPHGSGVDHDVVVDVDSSTEKRIVIYFDYHHMETCGVYDGWSNYKLVCEPSFIGSFTLKVVGKNKNNVKEYLGDLFYQALNAEFEDNV